MKQPRKFPFASRRIARIGVRQPGYVLCVGWDGGETSLVDIAPWVSKFAPDAALRAPDYFASARVGEHGWTAVWGDEEFEIDSIYLQLLEAEGRGVIYLDEGLKRWRARHGLSQAAAAAALGVSRRMMAYYESGQAFVPASIALACKGFTALRAEEASSRPAA